MDVDGPNSILLHGCSHEIRVRDLIRILTMTQIILYAQLAHPMVDDSDSVTCDSDSDSDSDSADADACLTDEFHEVTKNLLLLQY